MGEVVDFPTPKQSRYDPRCLEALSALPAPKTDRLSFLGSSELSDAEVNLLSDILSKHIGLHAIRVLGKNGEDLVLYRGQLPSFRSF
jgi:hypothetical protein